MLALLADAAGRGSRAEVLDAIHTVLPGFAPDSSAAPVHVS
jgi:hypothetical protein